MVGNPMKSKKSKINPEVWVYGTAIWGMVIPFPEIEILRLAEIFCNVYPFHTNSKLLKLPAMIHIRNPLLNMYLLYFAFGLVLSTISECFDLYSIFFGAWASFAGVEDDLCIAMGVLSIVSSLGSLVLSGHLLYGTRSRNQILIAIWVYGQVPMVLLSLVEIYLATALLTRGFAVHPGNREAIKNTAYYVGGHSIFLTLDTVFLLIVIPFWQITKRKEPLLLKDELIN